MGVSNNPDTIVGYSDTIVLFETVAFATELEFVFTGVVLKLFGRLVGLGEASEVKFHSKELANP